MANLKELRGRIASVRSTQKITSAMKLVAAAKLRRAQEQVQAARPYAERMEQVLASLTAHAESPPPLMAGRALEPGATVRHLLVPATADRGLCGGFNSSIVREVRRDITRLQGEGHEVSLYCLGRKGRDQLRLEHGGRILETVEDLTRPRPRFEAVAAVAEDLVRRFDAREFDVCTLYHARFYSALRQEPQRVRLIPLVREAAAGDTTHETTPEESGAAELAKAVSSGGLEFEPDQASILAELLPHNLSVQLWRAILENNASEHGARMTAMDNATRNAGDMIKRLTLVYNRTRQAAVTTELIEIISAKEAL